MLFGNSHVAKTASGETTCFENTLQSGRWQRYAKVFGSSQIFINSYNGTDTNIHNNIQRFHQPCPNSNDEHDDADTERKNCEVIATATVNVADVIYVSDVDDGAKHIGVNVVWDVENERLVRVSLQSKL